MEQRLAEVEQRVAALEGKEPRTMIGEDVVERLTALEARVKAGESHVEGYCNLLDEIITRLRTLEAASTPVAGRDMGMASQARRGTPERRLERSRG